MSENSKIEWTDHTFNPWIGCTKVSPGCAHCYAELSTRARVLRAGGQETWGKGAQRSRTTSTWGDPAKWNRQAEFFGQCPSCGHRGHSPNGCPVCGVNMLPARPRVFCASLADWLDDEVPIEWLVDLLDLIRNTPHLDWLLLTKRPSNWKIRIGLAARHVREHGGDMGLFCAWGHGKAPENIWIGTTVEDQQRAEERIPILLSIPAKVRFLSCEPLLGPVDLRSVVDWWNSDEKIHWVICGGESGSNARPMHPDWARSLRDQCQAAGVPFLFKQWGEWSPYASHDFYPETKPLTCIKPDGELSWCSGDLESLSNWSENYESTDHPIERTGKKHSGRLLDGREWNEFPTGKEVAA